MAWYFKLKKEQEHKIKLAYKSRTVVTILNSKLSFKWRKNLKKGLIQIEIRNVIKGIAKILAKYNDKIYHIIRVIFLPP